MNNVSNVFNSSVKPMTFGQSSMGSADWTKTATNKLFSSVGSQVIQSLGAQLGSSPAETQAAVASFGGKTVGIPQTVASLGKQFNLSPTQQGNLQRTSQDFATNLSALIMDSLRSGSGVGESASGGKGGGSLLVKIAMALGKLLDSKMSQMAGISDEIGRSGTGGPAPSFTGTTGQPTPGTTEQSKLGQLTGLLQGLSQEVSMLSNALTNTIKTLGEAGSTITRK